MATSAGSGTTDDQDLFLELKTICVPILSNSRLDARAVPKVLPLLSDLAIALRRLSLSRAELKPSLISYIFFPLSTLLSRNEAAAVPDQVLERVFAVLELLFRWWWWTCEEQVWTQVIMLAGAMLGPIGGKEKGKARERADETKGAAAQLLLCLLRDRSEDEDVVSEGPSKVESARSRLLELQLSSQTSKVVPVLGQTLNALLECAFSEHLPLQLVSLQTVESIISIYVPEPVMPSILPGVVSSMTRIALGQTAGISKGKGWANGSVVSASLYVLDVVVIRALGDDICLSMGLVKEVNGLEDLTELVTEESALKHTASSTTNGKPYETTRTTSWLRATASQLLVALNTLRPLLAHPTPLALTALTSLSHSLLTNTRLTLPNTRPLLISFFLILSNSQFLSVSRNASGALTGLLLPGSKSRHDVLQTVMQVTADGLTALPQLIPAHADARVEQIAGNVEAVCKLAFLEDISTVPSPSGGSTASLIRSGVNKLLGPTGNIEKWGWRLLSALQFAQPTVSVAAHGVLLLEADLPADGEPVVFPEASLAHLTSRDTQIALERMLHALGRAGGEDCLFSVEWFVTISSRRKNSSAAALWCACRILEGVAGASLDMSDVSRAEKTRVRGRRVEKFARWLVKAISELWEKEYDDEEPDTESNTESRREDDDADIRPAIEFVKGLTPLHTKFDVRSSKSTSKGSTSSAQRETDKTLRVSFALQLLSVSSSILQSRFSPLLMHALYPLLHSLVSPDPHVSSTAHSALLYISDSTGYASPANLLLSNFDYALDGASRRLTRRWIDVNAPKVLVVLVRLVGKEVVAKAGDVVEECFDRLDEFHGYKVIVEGLVEVLLEVVRVVETEEEIPEHKHKYAVPPESGSHVVSDDARFEAFKIWLKLRNNPPSPDEDRVLTPAPREAWGKGKAKEVPAPEEEDADRELLKEADDVFADPPATPTQALTSQIVLRSLYFLTHGSASIRARVLSLLARSVPVLQSQESSLLPAVHKAWPFIINRLGDSEPYVISAAAGLVEALAMRHGAFMTARIWDDVWPRFRTMLSKLDKADAESALARRGPAGEVVGTDSAYTHAHRLYRAMLRTMNAAVCGGVQLQDRRSWDVMLAFRRFLHKGAHEELQMYARQLYVALGDKNEDAVWLFLTSTASTPSFHHLEHLIQKKWDIQENVDLILAEISNPQQ